MKPSVYSRGLCLFAVGKPLLVLLAVKACGRPSPGPTTIEQGRPPAPTEVVRGSTTHVAPIFTCCSERGDGGIDGSSNMVIMVMVKRTSLAQAKAHLSELVDEAEHRGKRVIILRHGKPAAAIVPVHVAQPPRKRPTLTLEEAREFLRELGKQGDPDRSPVEDLLEGRR